MNEIEIQEAIIELNDCLNNNDFTELHSDSLKLAIQALIMVSDKLSNIVYLICKDDRDSKNPIILEQSFDLIEAKDKLIQLSKIKSMRNKMYIKKYIEIK